MWRRESSGGHFATARPRADRGSAARRSRRRGRPAGARRSSGRTAAGAGHEDLTPARVDHREGALGAGSESVERRDARDLYPESEAEAARDGEPDAHPGEAPRPRADDDSREIGCDEPCLAEELVDVGKEQSRIRTPARRARPRPRRWRSWRGQSRYRMPGSARAMSSSSVPVRRVCRDASLVGADMLQQRGRSRPVGELHVLLPAIRRTQSYRRSTARHRPTPRGSARRTDRGRDARRPLSRGRGGRS